jgi:hypothetical protein
MAEENGVTSQAENVVRPLTLVDQLKSLIALPDDFQLGQAKKKFIDARNNVWRRGEVPQFYPTMKKREGEGDEDFKKRFDAARIVIVLMFRDDAEVRIYALPAPGATGSPICITVRGAEVDEDEMSGEAFEMTLLDELLGAEEDEEADDELTLARLEMREWLQDVKDLRSTQNASKDRDKMAFNDAIQEAEQGLVEAVKLYRDAAFATRMTDMEGQVEENGIDLTPPEPPTPAQIIQQAIADTSGAPPLPSE